jgi:hypothetical protein
LPASGESSPEEIEIVPLVIVTQAFPARPSSLPDVRDFVRRRLTETPLSDDDVRILCERVADVLLDAAGEAGTIQVSLRMFPTWAEVDVVLPPAGQEGAHADRISAVPPRVPGPRPDAPVPAAPAAPPEPDAPVRVPALVGGGAEAAGVRPASVSFAQWLSAALRREGLTMEAAARRLNVSAKTVSRWVGGTTEPRLRDLSRIRDVFGEPPFV